MAFGLQLSTWDGRPTRHVPLAPLGSDHHGAWYRHAADFAVLVPEHGGWIARWGPDGGLDLHAKVTTATATTENGISAVDLDLDVVRFTDGRVAVVDPDRFDRRRVALAYPPELVAQALATARTLYRAVRQGDEPFTDGARRLAAARRAVLVGSP